MPPEIKLALKTGQISSGHARAILKLRKSLLMITLFHKIIRESLNVRQTEALSKRYAEHSFVGSKRKIIKRKNAEITLLENELISLLGTKVIIKTSKKGKGKINIEFYDNNDLQRIIDIITESE